MSTRAIDVEAVPVSELHGRLGFDSPLAYSEESLRRPLKERSMEVDDAPIFRYIYRNFGPQRHLEFGTWEGTGVLYCLEECDATVWTLNLLEGERYADGRLVYNDWDDSIRELAGRKNRWRQILWNRRRAQRMPKWSNRQPMDSNEDTIYASYYQTDARGFIGRKYLAAGLGHRVCQIYCDSRDWDISKYPAGFFDTCLIDGGHSPEVVANDSTKACRMVRSGGLIMWHDFCPDDEVLESCPSTSGVADALRRELAHLREGLEDLFWIDPSWILIGVRSGA